MIPLARDLDPGAVYEAELSYVWSALGRLGVPGPEREDLAHEVFVIALERMPSFDATRPLRPWLFGIALRVVARQRRRARYVREVPVATPDATDDRRPPDEAAAAGQEQRLVLKALEALDLDRRAVVVLHDLDGHPIPDVARALNLRLNTAYSRLRLGRAEFVAALRRLQGGAKA